MLNSIKAKIREKFKQLLRETIEEALLDDSYNISRAIQRQARDDSASFLLAHVPLDKRFGDRYTLMKHCLKLAPTNGLLLEFGVYKGNSVRFIGEQVAPRLVHGFDSFEGLDQAWQFDAPGAFSDVAGLPAVPSNVSLIKGWFDATLPDFLGSHPEPIALLHIDSDLYSSCTYVLEQVKARLLPGTVIVFDDMFNFPQWRNGEMRAFEEWRSSTGTKVEYIGFVCERGRDWSGHQVAVCLL